MAIDQYVREKKIEAVHLIKADAEGAEDGLEGAGETIRTARPFSPWRLCRAFLKPVAARCGRH